MLNPSTADETTDDPTVRRCISLAQRWGYGSFEAVNLFSYRSVLPANLLIGPEEKIGERCDENLLHAARGAKVTVAAWGSLPPALCSRSHAILYQLRAESLDIFCLGKNKDGSPRHPLYVPSGTKLMPFDQID